MVVQADVVRPSRTHFDRAMSQGAAQPTCRGEWFTRQHPARVGCATGADAARPRRAFRECAFS